MDLANAISSSQKKLLELGVRKNSREMITKVIHNTIETKNFL